MLDAFFDQEMAFFTFYPSKGFVCNPKNQAEIEKVRKDAGLKESDLCQPPQDLFQSLNVMEKLFLAPATGYKVFVIKYLEKMVPTGRQDPQVDKVVEFFQRWALDENVAGHNNLIIFVTDTLELASAQLYGQGRRCKEIRVPLPSLEQRRWFFTILQENEQLSPVALSPIGAIDDPIKSLASLSRGFTLYDCHALNSLAYVKNSPINVDHIEGLKNDIIRGQSRDLLAEVPLYESDCFDAIGGLEDIKAYLTTVKERMVSSKEEDKLSIPKGVLLSGPPGTGKTILARALAQESNIPMVRMGNIRSMWVGESERNLNRVLSLIEDLAPVLVFVDEIDQAIGGRSSVAGDSGVSQRMFGRLLEYMGREELRGQVLWVSASNRPDILDDAMIRRFDKVIPVLMPGMQEREMIFRALPKSISHLRYADNLDFSKLAALTENLTGSDLNVIVRTAMENGTSVDGKIVLDTDVIVATIKNFKSNHNEMMYNLQTLYSLRYCNFVNMIPKENAFPQSLHETVREALAQRSNTPIDKKIYEISMLLNAGAR